jgi:hypothetical protein
MTGAPECSTKEKSIDFTIDFLFYKEAYSSLIWSYKDISFTGMLFFFLSIKWGWTLFRSEAARTRPSKCFILDIMPFLVKNWTSDIKFAIGDFSLVAIRRVRWRLVCIIHYMQLKTLILWNLVMSLFESSIVWTISE